MSQQGQPDERIAITRARLTSLIDDATANLKAYINNFDSDPDAALRPTFLNDLAMIIDHLPEVGLVGDVRMLQDFHRCTLNGWFDLVVSESDDPKLAAEVRVCCGPTFIPDDPKERAALDRTRRTLLLGIASRLTDFLAKLRGDVAGATPQGQREAVGMGGKRKGGKRRRTAATRPLTGLQQQALALYGKHNGKLTDIAREMGVTHPTAHKHLKAAWRKLPNLAPKSGGRRGRTRRLPTDRRGQVSV